MMSPIFLFADIYFFAIFHNKKKLSYDGKQKINIRN